MQARQVRISSEALAPGHDARLDPIGDVSTWSWSHWRWEDARCGADRTGATAMAISGPMDLGRARDSLQQALRELPPGTSEVGILWRLIPRKRGTEPREDTLQLALAAAPHVPEESPRWPSGRGVPDILRPGALLRAMIGREEARASLMAELDRAERMFGPNELERMLLERTVMRVMRS